MDDTQRKALIEALIFVSENPLSLERMKEAIGGVQKREIQRLLSELMEEYNRAPRGFTLVEVAEGFQFRTRPEYAEWIKKLKRAKPLALTQPGLETLAIIAYKQPIVRGEIEKIRGVDSGGVLRTLLERKLIRILGKKDVPGKPLVYGTSRQFLEMFGLKDLSSLPTLKDIEGLGPSTGDEPFPFAASPEGEAKEMDSGRTDLPPGLKTEEDEPPAKNSEDFI